MDCKAVAVRSLQEGLAVKAGGMERRGEKMEGEVGYVFVQTNLLVCNVEQQECSA